MRHRILLSIVALTAVAVIAFATPLGFVLANLYHEEQVVRLQHVAAEVAERVPGSFPNEISESDFGSRRAGARVALYNRAGVKIAGLGPARADGIVEKAETGDLRNGDRDGTMIIGSPLVRGEKVVGVIRVEKSLRFVHRRTLDAILVMIAIGIGAVGLSALIGTYQSRRLARPVRRLAGAARRLGDGDFTVRGEHSGIPEIDAVSSALDTTAARLGRMLERERSFSDGASHQLRTPLTGLRLSLENARLDPQRERGAVLDEALGEIDRLERTIDDLLTLSREARAERPALDVQGTLHAIEDDWRGRFARSQRALRVEVEPALPSVNASDRAVRQIVDVLLDNALKHGRGSVTLHGRAAAMGVALEVSDEGPGIDGNPGRLFTGTGNGHKNHGLGLGLARTLADAEGARLELERAKPGAVFVLLLPSSQAENVEVLV